MSVAQQIEAKLQASFAPLFLELINESSGHNVPRGSETHFKLRIVSEAFQGLNLVARHRRVYEVLADEMKNGVHALSIEAAAPAEWKSEPGKSSPACLGGSKHDKNPNKNPKGSG